MEMGMKLAVVVLAIFVVVSGVSSEQRGIEEVVPELSGYWNQFQEQMKPIAGQFPSPPSGGFGSFPSFPGFGGGSGSASGESRYKRQSAAFGGGSKSANGDSKY